MGIGNLGNNFGKLTVKTLINNKVNNGKVNAAEVAKAEKSDIKGSLNSSTLKEGEGEKFDSNNVFNGSTKMYASRKKSFWDCIRDGINNRTSDKYMQNYVQNNQKDGGVGVVLCGVVDGIINYFRQ